MAINVKLYSDNWAYDISSNVINKGEIVDEEVISQSIELILATGYGERLFNPTFGSPLYSILFDHLDEFTAEKLIDDCISAINKWEDRIMVISTETKVEILDNENSIILTIPYIIKQTNKASIFEKQINF